MTGDAYGSEAYWQLAKLKVKRVEPSRGLLKGAPYTPSHDTNVGERFKRIEAERAPNVTPLRKAP